MSNSRTSIYLLASGLESKIKQKIGDRYNYYPAFMLHTYIAVQGLMVIPSWEPTLIVLALDPY